MVPLLPDDVINLITLELWQQEDFDTLYRFSQCSHQFAALALATLYRMQHASPIKTSNEPDIGGLRRGTKNLAEQTRKWARLWRSIVLSTKGRTIFPYSRYIRVLDLQDLVQLLEDLNGKFAGLQTSFFEELEEFRIVRQFGTRVYINETAVAVKMAEEITKHAPMLEELGGQLNAAVLPTWLPRLPRLVSIRLFDGSALKNCHDIIRTHCPKFKEIFCLHWASEDADQEFATFLEGLRPNSLESVTIHGRFLQERSFAALATHSGSLRSMQLQLSPAALSALPQLKNAMLLETVHLEDDMPTSTYSLSFEEEAAANISAWLSSCSRLRNLTIEKFMFGGKLVGPIMQMREIRLRNLHVRLGNSSLDAPFYRGLRGHTSLTSLNIAALADAFVDDTPAALQAGREFLDALCSLSNLRRLKLVDVSDYFGDAHIEALARALPLLEELTVGGSCITDAVWPPLAALQNLRLLGFTGLSVFTPEGIRGFVRSLEAAGAGAGAGAGSGAGAGAGAGRGLQLEIMAARDPMDEADRYAVEKELARLGGGFMCAPWREEEDSFDEDDDD